MNAKPCRKTQIIPLMMRINCYAQSGNKTVRNTSETKKIPKTIIQFEKKLNRHRNGKGNTRNELLNVINKLLIFTFLLCPQKSIRNGELTTMDRSPLHPDRLSRSPRRCAHRILFTTHRMAATRRRTQQHAIGLAIVNTSPTFQHSKYANKFNHNSVSTRSTIHFHTQMGGLINIEQSNEPSRTSNTLRCHVRWSSYAVVPPSVSSRSCDGWSSCRGPVRRSAGRTCSPHRSSSFSRWRQWLCCVFPGAIEHAVPLAYYAYSRTIHQYSQNTRPAVQPATTLRRQAPKTLADANAPAT